MNAELINSGEPCMVKVGTLVMPEYYDKEEIEGRENHLLTSITKHGVTQPIVINISAGRENIIINGNQVVSVCKLLGISEVPSFCISVPLEVEKELHFLLNNHISIISKDLVMELLGKSYYEYFTKEIDFGNSLIESSEVLPIPIPVKGRIKMITSHLNIEEKKLFDRVKSHMKNTNDSKTVKALINYFVKQEGI